MIIRDLSAPGIYTRCLAFLPILGLGLGCSQPEKLTPTRDDRSDFRQEDEWAVREMLIRTAISFRAWVDVWFIDFGDEKDPPPDFLNRFDDLEVEIKGVSEASVSQTGYVKDRRTGRDGYIVRAQIIRWLDQDTAEVEYTDYGSPQAASGTRGIVNREDGKWELRIRGGWES